MNYHKKIQTLGFKRTKEPLVVDSFDRYRDLIDGYQILSVDDFFVNRKKSSCRSFKQGDSYQSIGDLGIGGSREQLSKIQSYQLKISESSTLYLSILNQYYFCFLEDTSITDEPYVWYNKITSKKSVSIIHKSTFHQDFWKTILSNLPIVYKRDILLKTII